MYINKFHFLSSFQISNFRNILTLFGSLILQNTYCWSKSTLWLWLYLFYVKTEISIIKTSYLPYLYHFHILHLIFSYLKIILNLSLTKSTLRLKSTLLSVDRPDTYPILDYYFLSLWVRFYKFCLTIVFVFNDARKWAVTRRHFPLSLVKSSLFSCIIALPLSSSFFSRSRFLSFPCIHSLHRSPLNPSFLSLFPLSRFRTISLNSSGVHLLFPYFSRNLTFSLHTFSLLIPVLPLCVDHQRALLSVSSNLSLNVSIYPLLLRNHRCACLSPPSLSTLRVSTPNFLATEHLLFLISRVFSLFLRLLLPLSSVSSPKYFYIFVASVSCILSLPRRFKSSPTFSLNFPLPLALILSPFLSISPEISSSATAVSPFSFRSLSIYFSSRNFAYLSLTFYRDHSRFLPLITFFHSAQSFSSAYLASSRLLSLSLSICLFSDSLSLTPSVASPPHFLTFSSISVLFQHI